jgi:hypothetical protein
MAQKAYVVRPSQRENGVAKTTPKSLEPPRFAWGGAKPPKGG